MELCISRLQLILDSRGGQTVDCGRFLVSIKIYLLPHSSSLTQMKTVISRYRSRLIVEHLSY